MLHRWMVEAREPDTGVQHWKLGFQALCIGADGHRREKRTVSLKMARSFGEANDNAPLPDSVFDVPFFADAEITCCEAFLIGGRITYNGKESHIMSLVNAWLNKNVVRRAADRLMKIADFGRTPTTNDATEKVIPLRDVVWVGAPLAAVVNYKLNKRANRCVAPYCCSLSHKHNVGH